MVLKTIRNTIEAHKLINKNEHIVIGLSGGPDSMCLFNGLLELSKDMSIKLHPVHVNHMLRPGAAEGDQNFVENLCLSKGIICHSFVVDCNRLAAEEDMTSEEAGRKARYDAFYTVACQIEKELKKEEREAGVHVKIAVAQNADDQAETILFRLLRGTGTDGLAGMAYSRQEREFTVIRPLLDVSRERIEEYCSENKLNPVRDHTNEEAIYARNKIRLELLPVIEERYNRNIKEALIRLGKIAAYDKEYIWQQVDEAYKELLLPPKFKSDSKNIVILDRKGLGMLHKALRHRVILKALSQIGLTQDMTEERLAAADRVIELATEPKKVEFPHGYEMNVSHKQVMFR